MTQNKSKRVTAVLLCVTMLLMALVSGCGGGGTPSDVDSAKEALIGTWYSRYENDEGEVKGSDSNKGWTFYENGTCQIKDAYGEPWYTWELLRSEESGQYTLMLEEKKAYSSQRQEVNEIQFDGNDHFIFVDGDTHYWRGVEFYRDAVETKDNNE